MIAKEVRYRLEHYIILIVLISGCVAAFFVVPGTPYRSLLSFFYGAMYIVWGIWSHRGEHYTLRLVLEYIFVGILGVALLRIVDSAI